MRKFAFAFVLLVSTVAAATPPAFTVTTTPPLAGGQSVQMGSSFTLSCPTCITTSGSYADPAWITSLAGSKINGAVPLATAASSATTALTAGSFTNSLAGDVTGTQSATVVGKLQGFGVATTAPTDAQVLRWNGTSSQWEPSTTTATGSITLNTSSPLGGGGTVALGGSLTLTCATCVLTSGSYADPAWITSLAGSKISGAVANATTATTATNFSGSLAGDVTGTQSATTVGKLRGRTVAATAPTDQQVLLWVAANSDWEPGSVSGASGGTVTQVNTGNGLQGGPITSTGTVDLRLNASGGLTKTLGGGSNELGISAAGVSNAMLANSAVTVTAGTGLAGGGSVALGSSVTLSLPSVGPGAGAQTLATGDSVTLDAQGRVTAVSTVTRTLSAGTGITGGGTLAADRSFAVDQTFAPTWTGVHTFSKSSIATAQTEDLVVTNTTAAAAGAQQYSPVLALKGQGWKTNATAASQETKWGFQVQPVQGAAAPTSNLVFLNATNAGSYSALLTVADSGLVTVTNKITGLTQATGSTDAVAGGRNVSAGTGLSGGGALTSDVTISMPNTGPGATTTGGGGTYIASITTDAQGRISSLATGTPAGSMAIGGSITSGTSKSVLYVDGSGNLAQDNANFAWDYTNHRLGIGQVSPSYPLHVESNSIGAAQTIGGALINTTAATNVLNQNSPGLYYRGQTWNGAASSEVEFLEQLTAVQVLGSASTGQVLETRQRTAGSGSWNQLAGLVYNTTNDIYQFLTGTPGSLVYGVYNSPTNYGFVGSVSSIPFALRSANTDRLVIDAAGHVGVNYASNATLTYQFAVSGTAHVTGTSTFDGQMTVNNKITGLTQATGSTDAVAGGRSISAGTGLSGGGDLTADRTISMPNVGPGAGTVGSSGIASITLDAQGRVTAATTGTYLTSAFYQTIKNSAGTAQTQRSNLKFGSDFSVSDSTPDTVVALASNSLTITAGTGLSGGGAVALGSSVSLSLPNVGPGAGAIGSAGISSITLDAQGRVTAATAATYLTSAFYQTFQNAGSGLTQRATANFAGGLTAADNSGSTRTDITIGGTADTAFSTGAFSWAGASGKAGSLVATSAAITITAAATSIWSTTTGNLTLDAASSLLLGPTNATTVQLGRAGQTTNVYGNVTLGSASSDNVTITGTIIADVNFNSSVRNILMGAQGTADAAANALLILGSQGGAASSTGGGAGGSTLYQGGVGGGGTASLAGGAGGLARIRGGTAGTNSGAGSGTGGTAAGLGGNGAAANGASNATAGGQATWNGGPGGAAATGGGTGGAGGAVSVTGGTGGASAASGGAGGAGGAVTILGGSPGADNGAGTGTGGALIISGGSGVTGFAGTNGTSGTNGNAGTAGAAYTGSGGNAGAGGAGGTGTTGSAGAGGQGGAGGALSFPMGTGGAGGAGGATTGAGAAGAGGAGGNSGSATFGGHSAGAGGAGGTSSGGGTNGSGGNGGAAGSLSVVGANGGAGGQAGGAGATAGNGGVGGAITIAAGAGGNGGPANGGTQGNGANGANLTLRGGAKGTGASNGTDGTVTIGDANTSAIALGVSGITTTITGGLTQLTGAVSLTGNGASSLTTTSGALTLTSAAAGTWDSKDGTVKAGTIDRSTAGALLIGTSTASSVSIAGASIPINAGRGTVTQATSITTGVTVNTPSGVITTVSASTAAGSTSTFTVTCGAVATTSVVVVSLGAYSGTLGTNGTPIVTVSAVNSGSFDVKIYNAHASNALSGTLKINYVAM